MRNEFESRKFIDEYRKTYMELREKEKGFSGVSFQMYRIEENMINDFERSVSIKHPGDKGSSRETFLRKFLTDYEYIPPKYGISKGSSHVISSTGHISSQIDILIYDKLSCPKLLTMDDIQFFPIESVLGVIEVKSNLDSKETLYDALNKIASFKKIPCSRASVINVGGFKAQSLATRGFGIIFAYDATLKWKTIFNYMKQYQKENDKTEWTNMICILNQGIILQTGDNKAVFSSNEIEESRNNNLMGMPSTSGNLLNLYLILMDLLNNANLPAVNVRDYVFINNPVEDKSYYFTYGEFGELGKCKKHGSYLKKISNSSIQKIVSECKDEKSINWLKAMDIAYGDALDEERYEKQPRNVKIYNPEKLELSQILIDEEGLYPGLLFEDIIIDGVSYWVPYYYAIKEKLIKYCPKCEEEKGKE